jgi:tetratricopeptide (TPR) repeat protein
VADALFALWQGRLAAAEPLIEAAFRLGERAQPWTANTDYRLQTFLLRRHRGELGGYEAVLRSSLDDYPGYRIFDCALSSAYAHLDRRDECREVFESMAADSFECLSREGDWLTNLCFLSEACSYLGDRERAQVLIELLAPYAGQNAVACGEVVLGTVAQHLGRLEGEVERFEDAEAQFETAIEMNTRLGARPWLAEAQADYGRMLLVRGQGRDVARATALLAEAHATYEELGMVESRWRSRETSAAP